MISCVDARVGRHDRRAGIATKERLPLDTALFQAAAKYAAVDKEAEARAVELDDDVIMYRTWEEGGGGIYILRLLRLRDQ